VIRIEAVWLATARLGMRAGVLEQASEGLKSDLAMRPIWHKKDERIEATSSWPSSPTACR